MNEETNLIEDYVIIFLCALGLYETLQIYYDEIHANRFIYNWNTSLTQECKDRVILLISTKDGGDF